MCKEHIILLLNVLTSHFKKKKIVSKELVSSTIIFSTTTPFRKFIQMIHPFITTNNTLNF